MATYTITLTDEEDKALHVVALDGQEWIENLVKTRARLAMEEIAKKHIDEQLAKGEPLAGLTHEEIVKNIEIESAAERHARFLEEADLTRPGAPQ
jgi:hypothetical protein